MDLYTMNSSFVRQEILEDYTSVVWTERYAKPGDIELFAPANSKSAKDLASAVFLNLEGTDEIMLIESRSVEDDKLKISGPTLTDFLNHRPFRLMTPSKEQSSFMDGTPGLLLDFVAVNSVGDSAYLGAGVERLGGPNNSITNLTFPRFVASFGMGDYLREHGDETGAWVYNYPVTFGQLGDVLGQISNTFQVGYGVYLASADEDGYSLEFRSYIGRNLASDQTTYPTVQFSSVMDTLKSIKELYSITGYKNVAYVYSTNAMGTAVVDPGVAYADASAEDSIDFNRRVIFAYNTDIKYTDEETEDSETNYNTILKPALDKAAKDLLANNNYVRIVDGEIVPQVGCVYGVDYVLGDIVELLGSDGAKQKARITEYIRSKDKTGERAYPTVSLVE